MTFSVEWLTLREGYDLRARNPAVLNAVTSLLKPKSTVRICDLACGTGSTLRALGPHLPARQNWDLVDNDPRLLNAACNGRYPDEVRLNAVQLDLSGDFEPMLDGDCDLITTSALLDLVSEAWLDGFAGQVSARALAVYAALTYDGRIDLAPADQSDGAVAAAVNTHQRGDKGFGPALGPSGGVAAMSRFEALGYRVLQGTSDWVIGTDDQAIQSELLNGWASAARATGLLPRHEIDDWLTRRKAVLERRLSTMRVGHLDFVATPSTTR
jgi:hypothetical protein